MDRSEEIKRVIVQAVGNAHSPLKDPLPGEWKAISVQDGRMIAEAVYEALKSRGYLVENST